MPVPSLLKCGRSGPIATSSDREGRTIAGREHLGDERGFTLVELMVVVLIIAILLAVAIPTFLSVRVRAQNIAARSSVTDAYKAQRAVHVTDGAYTNDGDVLEDVEPTINYATPINPSCVAFESPKCVQVVLLTPLEVLLIGQASNGLYWAIRDIASGPGAGIFYNTGGSSVLPGPADVTDGSW